jgi:nitric oxide reductase large subunit
MAVAAAGIGLMLSCLRGRFDRDRHSDRVLRPAYWCLNLGLAMMVFRVKPDARTQDSLRRAKLGRSVGAPKFGNSFARSP